MSKVHLKDMASTTGIVVHFIEVSFCEECAMAREHGKWFMVIVMRVST
jgi:hypothetical protein